jgi:RNA polymerase sigma-70 factor (ECF subfamily)
MVNSAAAGTQLVTAGDLLDQGLESLLKVGYRLAVVILRDRDEAEDAVQDAATIAWRRVGQLRDPSALRSWFLTIVARQCRSRLRHRWREVLKVRTVDRPVSLTEDWLVDRLDVSAAVTRLSTSDRTALYLYYFEDLTLPDAARVVGCRVAAFRSRLYRALDRLRSDLERPGEAR